MKTRNLLLLCCLLAPVSMAPLSAQGKAGKSTVTLAMLWEDFLKEYRSLEGTITLRATAGQSDIQSIHIDELFSDWVALNAQRPMALYDWQWNFTVGYQFRPYRPVNVSLNLDFRPIQYSRLYNGFNEYMNWSLNTSWDIGSDLNVTVNLTDQNQWNYDAAQNVYGRLLSIVRSEGDASTALGGVNFRKYNKIFFEFKPVKTLQPLEPKFSVEVTSGSFTYGLTALDSSDPLTRNRQYNDQLNILTMSGSLVLRLDQYEAGISYKQDPDNNAVKVAGGYQKYLQQNWSTYIQFRLDRYTTFRTTLSYGRQLNRYDSVYRTSMWDYAREEQTLSTRYFNGYMTEHNNNGTTIQMQVQMR